MKRHPDFLLRSWNGFGRILLCVCLTVSFVKAQDTAKKEKAEPVKYIFESVWLIDNQTVIVPLKGTIEFDIQHRFGTINNGSEDIFGLFAPSNIRLGLNYAPFKRLFVGAGLTKERMEVDLNGKYALLRQTSGSMPVSVSYFANMAIDTRNKSNFRYDVHRYSYFHQLLIARKITQKFSAQVAPSYSWFNNVEGYVDGDGVIQKKMENGHLAIAFMGAYKFTNTISVLANYDQPLTEHLANNPHPNLSLGVEFNTGGHSIQVFLGNYGYILPQNNNFLNQNEYEETQFLIGFNITRIWD